MVNAGGVFQMGEAVSVDFLRGIVFGVALAAVANVAIAWAMTGGTA